jgi:hypothetical protein
MNTSLVARIEVQPRTVAPMGLLGVDYERVDPSTRRVIHTLFPSHTRGFAFYTGLLRNAIVKQCTLPDNPTEARRDTAVVSIKGYAELRLRLRLSYDTTHMYILIYRALGLLYIEKYDGLTTIIIPLGAYHPPAGLAETLLQLRERYRSRRPKVGRLVSKIIERIAAFIQLDSEQESCNRTTPLQHDHPLVYAELLTRIQQELAAQGVADPSGQIADGMTTALIPFLATHIEDYSPPSEQHEKHADHSRTCRKDQQGEMAEIQRFPPVRSEKRVDEEREIGNLPTLCSKEVSEQGSVLQETEQPRAHGRFSVQNLPTVLPKGESTHVNAPQIPTHSVKCGRFLTSNLLPSQQTSEVVGHTFPECGSFPAPNLPTNRQVGDAPQAAPELASMNLPLKVDSGVPLLNGNGRNGNGEKNIHNIYPSVDTDSVPVKMVSLSEEKRPRSPRPRQSAHTSLINQAKALAKLVEGNEENVGAYIALIQQYDPRTLRAAVIATLLRKHWPQGRGILRKPGGYYTRRVQQFQHTIPEPILSLLQTYELASYEEIDAALGAQARMQAARRESATSARQGTIRPKRGAPMCQATAEMLARRIPQEDSSVQVRGLYEEDGIYAVRVYIAPVEHLFASIEDWGCYHAQMQLLEQEECA